MVVSPLGGSSKGGLPGSRERRGGEGREGEGKGREQRGEIEGGTTFHGWWDGVGNISGTDSSMQ